MTIKTKMIAGFCLLLLIVLAYGGVRLNMSYNKAKEIEKIYTSDYPIDTMCKQLKLDVIQIQQFLTDISATRGLNGLNDGFKEAQTYKKDADEVISKLKSALANNSSRIDVLNGISASLDDYYEIGKKMANEYIQNGTESGNAVMVVFDKKSDDIAARVESLNKDINSELQSKLTTMIRNSYSAIKWLAIAGLLILIGGIVGSFIAALDITKPLINLVNTIREFVSDEGNLGKRLPEDRKDEIGELARVFNTFIEKLSTTLSRFTNVNERISTSVSEVYVTAEETAMGATGQTQKIDEIVRSINQMYEATSEMARSTHELSTSANIAAEASSKGSDVVNRTISGMNNIRNKTDESSSIIKTLGDKSTQIGEIVQVIHDIADQTNLLALNAAIEAARAGEQGRGFAVVADEVRKLAEKTGSATRQISSMITEIQENTSIAVSAIESANSEVSSGSQLINSAGSILSEILSMNNEIKDKIMSIAAATEEQSMTANDISGNVEKIGAFASELSSNANRSALAAEELSSFITDHLDSVVKQFKVSSSNVRQLSNAEIEAKVKSVAPLFIWNDNYSVGVKKFDDHHKELIGMVNNLHAYLKIGVAGQVISDILNKLAEYTVNHFKAEEELLTAHKYPKEFMDAHLNEHHKLLETVTNLKNDMERGKGAVTIHVMNFLKKWLHEHILEIDKKYRPHLNSRGVY